MSEYLKPNQLVKKGTVLDSSYYGVFVMLEDSGSHCAAKVRMIKPKRAEHSIDDEPNICPLVHGSGTKIVSLPGPSDLEKLAAGWLKEGDRLEASGSLFQRKVAQQLKDCSAELTRYILTH